MIIKSATNLFIILCIRILWVEIIQSESWSKSTVNKNMKYDSNDNEIALANSIR